MSEYTKHNRTIRILNCEVLMRSFGEVLGCIMDKRGVGQAELARRTGLSKAYISQLVSGKISSPNFERAILLASGLDVSVQEFANRMTEMPMPGSAVHDSTLRHHWRSNSGIVSDSEVLSYIIKYGSLEDAAKHGNMILVEVRDPTSSSFSTKPSKGRSTRLSDFLERNEDERAS